MAFTLVYDITAQPLVDVPMCGLSAVFVIAGILVKRRQRVRDRRMADPPQRPAFGTPQVLIWFGVAVALIGVVFTGWDRWRLVRALRAGEAGVVEGPVQSWGTERVSTSGRSTGPFHTYERFYIGDSIWFGYYWEVEQAGFHNSGAERVRFRDGLAARATYLHADGADQPPRIVRLEVDTVAAVGDRIRRP